MNGVSSDLRDLSPAALRSTYLDCLLAPDLHRARDLMSEALDAGVSAASLYLQVIAPAMHEVGRRWELAQISVAGEHLATQITRTVIAALASKLARGEPIGLGRIAVVSSTRGELHALGMQMVADFLEAQSWNVFNLGPDTPPRDLVTLVAEHGADVVALSTALSSHLLSVNRTCQLLRRLDRPPFIVAGGRAYDGDPRQALAVGADAFCDDPQALLDLLGRRFAHDAEH